jgi:hypothetical protein
VRANDYPFARMIPHGDVYDCDEPGEAELDDFAGANDRPAARDLLQSDEEIAWSGSVPLAREILLTTTQRRGGWTIFATLSPTFLTNGDGGGEPPVGGTRRLLIWMAVRVRSLSR